MGEERKLFVKMSEKVAQRMEKLRLRMDAVDEGEVIRRALAVYEEILSLTDQNLQIVARDDEGKETTLRFL